MRLGLVAGQFGPDITIDFDLILEAERLGYSSVWTAEAYGNDAIVPLARSSRRAPRGSASAPRSCRCRRALRR